MRLTRRQELLKGAARGGFSPGEAAIYSWKPWDLRQPAVDTVSGLAGLAQEPAPSEAKKTLEETIKNLGPVWSAAIAGAAGAVARSGFKMGRMVTFGGLGAAMGYLAKEKLGVIGQDPLLVAVGVFVSTMYVPLPGGGE